MSEFVYLYREASMPASPQAMQDRMVKWLAWFKDLEQKGHVVALGHPLNRTDGGVVRDKKGSLEAKDFEQAVKLSTGCPLLDEGGLVEVRPILKL
jgi:hypothetical protein